MAIPRVDTCCSMFDLKTGGLLISVICALGYIAQIQEQPPVKTLIAYIFVLALALGAYFAAIYGIIKEKSYYVKFGLIGKGCEMIILTAAPIVDYFYLHPNTNPLSQALIIVWVLNAYYWIVMYSLYKEIQEHEYENIRDIQPYTNDEQSNINDIEPNGYHQNNMYNFYRIGRVIVIAPPNNPDDFYQNIA